MMAEHNETGIIAVAIVEDAEDYRDILRATIESEPDMCVEGDFADAESYIAALPALDPRVVIMDINLPGASGIEAVIETKKRAPRAEVMMCTVFDEDEKVFASLRAGACGYILKSTPLDAILEAIREVHGGGAPMTPKIARKVLGVFQAPGSDTLAADGLTRREMEILHLLGEGKTYQAICREVSISYGTVQSHVKSIYSKLEIHSKSEIIAWLAEKRAKGEIRRD
jgi:two-component system, NarL family, response regulator LiaR